MGLLRKPQASSSQSICSGIVCPVLGNIMNYFVQNVASFLQRRRSPSLLNIRNYFVLYHLLPLLEKELFKTSSRFCVLLNLENSCIESCGGRQTTCTYFESHLNTTTDEFSCLFCNYSYNLSSIWKQKGITYHDFSRRLPIWTLGRNDGRCPANLCKYIPVIFQSLLLYRPRHLSTSHKFPWKLFPIFTKLLLKNTFGEIEF
jgi:hypothetical protein